MTQVKDWKKYRVSPEAEKILVKHQVRKIKETNKSVSRVQVLNDLILNHRLVK